MVRFHHGDDSFPGLQFFSSELELTCLPSSPFSPSIPEQKIDEREDIYLASPSSLMMYTTSPLLLHNETAFQAVHLLRGLRARVTRILLRFPSRGIFRSGSSLRDGVFSLH